MFAWRIHLALLLSAFFLISAGLSGCDGTDTSPSASSTVETEQTHDLSMAGGTETPATTGPLFAFLGDSVTAGLHVDELQAFPALIEASLRKKGRPLRVLNAGRSGDTTAGGLRRIDWILAQKPQWVVVELGANDGMSGQKVQEIEKNLRAIVARVQAAGARPLLLGMRIPSNYGVDYAESFAQLYDQLAADLKIDYVPFFMEGVAGVAKFNHSDGIHPNAEGHRIIADRLAPVIERLLAGDS